MSEKSKNEKIYDEAWKAIMKLFSDTSVSKEQAIDNLATLIDEIQDLIHSLEV